MHQNKNLFKYIVVILSAIIFTSSEISYAQNEHKRTGWWGSVETGIGYVGLSHQEYKKTNSHFYLGFSGGYSINPSFLVGVELSGWLFEGSDAWDPSKGEGISQVLAITRFYPLKDKDFFAKFGCGYVSHWNNHPDAIKKGGWGLAFGAGYDFAINSYWSITPFLTYNYGDLQDQTHNTITLGIGVTFN